MGWRGTLRSINAAVRAAERDSRRRQRELDRQQKEYEKMLELERAAYEVEVFTNYLERLVSLHKESINAIDWTAIASQPEPSEPKRSMRNEQRARIKLESYQPGLADRLFKRAERARKKLKDAIDAARAEDETAHRNAQKQYEKNHEDWRETQEFSRRVLQGDLEAYRSALQEMSALKEIGELGSSVQFSFSRPEIMSATVHVHGEEVIPREVKSLLKSGRLSVKQMPKGKFYELYQDYVCSVALRVAGELLALLPFQTVVVTATDKLLNSTTGHIEEQPILSVAIPRSTLDDLNLGLIDPSDSMQNFIHNMNFKKTKGFTAIEMVDESAITKLGEK